MPIKTLEKSTEDLTEHIVSGSVTDKEMFDCESEFYAMNPTQLQMWDMSDAKLDKVTIDGMRQFIARRDATILRIKKKE